MQIIHPATAQTYFVGQPENLSAALHSLGLNRADVTLRLTPHEAHAIAGEYIERHYPLYRQVNLLRTGVQAEIERMSVFIDACRAWANGASPDPMVLVAILPEAADTP